MIRSRELTARKADSCQKLKRAARSIAHSIVAVVALAAFATVANAQSCEDPEELTFAMVPTEETVAELQLYKPVTDRLAMETGKKIQFFMPTSYASVVEGLLGQFIDVAVLGPYSYVIANSKDSTVEVFATYAKRPGHLQEEGPGYKAALVTKKGSKIHLNRLFEWHDSRSGRSRQHFRQSVSAGCLRPGGRWRSGRILWKGRLYG